jgi:DNA polymerase III delta subunit
MRYQEFVQKLGKGNSGKSYPVYGFFGPEEFLRRKGLEIISQADKNLSAGVKRFPPDNFNAPDFFQELYAVPFFQQRKLVVLNLGVHWEMMEKMYPDLEEYLRNPSPFSILVINAEQWVPHSKVTRLIEEKGIVIECTPMPSWEINRWVITEVRAHGKSISAPVVQALIERTGNALDKIDDAIQRLVLFLGPRTAITPEDIRESVENERDYVLKELAQAVLQRKKARALTILNRLVLEGAETNKIIGYLRGVFKRENLGRAELKSRITDLLEADLSIKTGLLPEDQAISRLILKLTQ